MEKQFKYRIAKGDILAVLMFFVLIVPFHACKKDEIVLENNNGNKVIDEGPVQYGIPFSEVPEVQDVVLYEVNPLAFSSQQNIDGITSRLDEIKSLGVNVVWLMPIYPTGELKSVGSPYAVKDYTSINPDYGTLEDLRELVDEAHTKGMAVMLDWVANHTSWDNEWIENKSWYTTDESGNITYPETWQDVADLNYNNSSMRKEMIAAMKYWALEANVDGFRCDYAGGVPNDFWKAAIDTLRKIPNRDILMFAETDKKSVLDAGFDMIFGWNFYGKTKQAISEGSSAFNIVNAHTSDYQDLADNKHIVRWITNHDDNAHDNIPQALFNGERGSVAAFVLSAYMGGVPLIYNGQEVGYDKQLDFFKANTTIIDWNYNNDLLEEYTNIIQLKKTESALRNGDFTSYGNSDVVAFTRTINNEEVFVVVNIRESAYNYNVPDALQGEGWYNGYTKNAETIGTTIALEGYGYKVFVK